MQLRGTIIHPDEVLTMSARMAAATGNLWWEERYRGFEPRLDAAIEYEIRCQTFFHNVPVPVNHPSMVSQVDKILFLRDGVVEMFGPRDEVLPRLTRPAPVVMARTGS